MKAYASKALTAAALSILSLGAFATTYNGECTDQPKSRWMNTADVKAKFEAQGYSIGRVKTGGSCYEVYAKDKAGKKIELFVNPVDASVVGQAGTK